MPLSDKTFNAIIERCRLSLRINYLNGSRFQAEPLFEAEVRLIQKLGFEDTLAEIAEYGDQLYQRKLAFHLIGVGGSSVIFYLLGFSEVDPVRYDTYFQRLWLTSSREPPRVLFVVMPSEDMPRQPRVSAHPMTAQEAIPELLHMRFPNTSVLMTEHAVLNTIQGGDTHGIFQLESEPIRSLLSQVGPTRIRDLGTVTALEQIRITHPEVVSEYLKRHLEKKSKRLQRPVVEAELTPLLPLLFQETIMKLLHRHAGLPWEETYRFVQAAAKGRMTDQHELWNPVLEGLEQHHGANGELLFERLVAGSRWAVCRAHHIANAITSYRAAYYRTIHRQAFEDALQQVSCWERRK